MWTKHSFWAILVGNKIDLTNLNKTALIYMDTIFCFMFKKVFNSVFTGWFRQKYQTIITSPLYKNYNWLLLILLPFYLTGYSSYHHQQEKRGCQRGWKVNFILCDLQYTIMLSAIIWNTFSRLYQIYFIVSQRIVFINTIWTFGANNIPHSLLYPRQVTVFYIRSAMCSGDLFWGSSWRSCCGQTFQFYYQRLPKASQNLYTFNLSVAFTVTSSVHAHLCHLHVPIRFPLKHSPWRTPKPPHQCPRASPQWGKNS